jgi:hypothetical protein
MIGCKPGPVTIDGQTYTHKHKNQKCYLRQVTTYCVAGELAVVASICLAESGKEEFFAMSKGHFDAYYQEILEERTDWSKVPIDAKIEVFFNDDWERRYFAGVEEGKPYYFAGGTTSYTELGKVEFDADCARFYKP